MVQVTPTLNDSDMSLSITHEGFAETPQDFRLYVCGIDHKRWPFIVCWQLLQSCVTKEMFPICFGYLVGNGYSREQLTSDDRTYVDFYFSDCSDRLNH